VAAELAKQKGLSVEAIAEATSQNFEQLFGVQLPIAGAAA
jgi:Tat protein secretion system quality control protein TatD with DNase activity